MQRRTRSNSNEVLLLVQRAASVRRRLEDVQGDGHCGIHSIVDQLQQQSLLVTMQSVRTDTAAWLSDKQYAWSQYPQDDACNWENIRAAGWPHWPCWILGEPHCSCSGCMSV